MLTLSGLVSPWPFMKIAVISDLHVGGEAFAENARGYEQFLNHLEKTHDEIILLGDIFEAFNITRIWAARRIYLENQARYERLTRRFFKHPYLLLTGNHDLTAERNWNIPSQAVREVDGLRIFLAHGHQYDRLYRGRSYMYRLADLLAWITTCLKKIGFTYFYRLQYRLDHAASVKNGGKDYIRAARKILQEENFDLVVMGHTHKEKYLTFPEGGIFIDCGDNESRKMYASINTANVNTVFIIMKTVKSHGRLNSPLYIKLRQKT